jgi:hypothetical protein
MCSNEKIYDIQTVTEVPIERANEYLRIGWMLLAVCVKNEEGKHDGRNEQAYCCLGWPKSLGEERRP